MGDVNVARPLGRLLAKVGVWRMPEEISKVQIQE